MPPARPTGAPPRLGAAEAESVTARPRSLEFVTDRATPVAGELELDLVAEADQGKVGLSHRVGSVVGCRSCDMEQLAATPFCQSMGQLNLDSALAQRLRPTQRVGL